MTTEQWKPGDVLESKQGRIVEYIGEGLAPDEFEGRIIEGSSFETVGAVRKTWGRQWFTLKGPTQGEQALASALAEIERLKASLAESERLRQEAVNGELSVLSRLEDARQQIERLTAESAKLREALKEVLDAMKRYDMDVDDEPTWEHRQIMAQALAALGEATK